MKHRIVALAGLMALGVQPFQAQAQAQAATASGAAEAVAPIRVDLTRSSAGYNYFNRPGASLDQHDAAVRACLAEARKMSQPDDNGAAAAGAAGGLLGALVVGVIQGAVNGMQERRGVTANLENCMVVEGWRVVRLDEAEGKLLDALEQAELRAALADKVGVETPAGQVVRVFDNDAARGDTVVIGRAGDLDKVSLSLQALPETDAKPEPARKGPQPPRTARPPRALKPEEVAVNPGDALITVRLTGMAEQGGQSLIFTRQGPAPDIQPWESDGRPALFAVTLPTRGAARGDRTRAVTQTFAVPPGRWRLSAINAGPYFTHFCLGSSGFEARDGEAIYAGAIDLSGPDRRPDLTPRDDLLSPASPAAQAGVVHRIADWTYGDKEQCQGAYLYALDLAPAVGAAAETPATVVEPTATPVEAPASSPTAPETTTAPTPH
ncbi:hypothetical protein [Brevundimonas sp. SORGH_AS_0993]|uniref:hypothetical protein n=1 Tax=Brevundimonas sp. SORGH_AS_0993 TaxID=3041794 RepID=UPI002781A30E|nr:hypothetical protein [Brevundimonas sp. SORGH_AS_0993]MDQ1154121.1 hypothetical protein [Brevundimonas sp. SORGH_AS_0993]